MLPSLQNTETGPIAPDDLAVEIEATRRTSSISRIAPDKITGMAPDKCRQEQLDWLRDRLWPPGATAACRGASLVLHHPPYVTRRQVVSRGRPCYAINSRRGRFRWPPELEEATGSSKGEATPAGSGLSATPTAWAAAQRRHRQWRRPHSVADCGGSATRPGASAARRADLQERDRSG